MIFFFRERAFSEIPGSLSVETGNLTGAESSFENFTGCLAESCRDSSKIFFGHFSTTSFVELSRSLFQKFFGESSKSSFVHLAEVHSNFHQRRFIQEINYYFFQMLLWKFLLEFLLSFFPAVLSENSLRDPSVSSVDSLVISEKDQSWSFPDFLKELPWGFITVFLREFLQDFLVVSPGNFSRIYPEVST